MMYQWDCINRAALIYRVPATVIQYNACKNIEVGTWILSQSIADGKTIWSGIGNWQFKTMNGDPPY